MPRRKPNPKPKGQKTDQQARIEATEKHFNMKCIDDGLKEMLAEGDRRDIDAISQAIPDDYAGMFDEVI